MDFSETPEKKLYKRKPAPLLCWDIYSDYLLKQRSKAEDINFLNSFFQEKLCPSLLNWKEYFNKCDAVVITSPEQKIEWVSAGFFSMTGYTRNEAINRKPTFLQGEKTDLHLKQELKDKLKHSKRVEANLVNYRKNGGEYLCYIEIEPVYNQNEKLVNFIAFEKEVR